ncbi:MAG: GWxTD domain-containing protein [Flavobacteriales bacterium]|nr:GWxTD domain-containing protein [Flavobacteriales bacterium]
MKKRYKYAFSISALVLIINVVPSIGVSQGLKSYFNYSIFISPPEEPYLETHLTFAGATLRYKKNKDELYTATIDATLTITKNDSVIISNNYEINSPTHNDEVIIPTNFLDITKTFIDTGKYILTLTVKDQLDTIPALSFTENISISTIQNIAFSDIQLLESYYPSTASSPHIKNGYAMIPYPLQSAPGRVSFIPESVDTISFYTEIYNTIKVLGDTGKYLITYFIEDEYTHYKLKNQIRYSRAKSEIVKPFLAKIDLSKIYSGNYNLVIQINDENNQFLARKKLEFQRSKNPVEVSLENLKNISIKNTFVTNIKDKETMINHLKCIQLIGTSNEIIYAENRIKEDDLFLMQQFFFYFWEKRNPDNPELEWKEYIEKVKFADKHYGSIMRQGFETDRGRIFLKHGKPSVLNKYKNTERTFPYEIWQYNILKGSRNRKIVFYNPTMVGNEYPILHSNILGERNNPKWTEVLIRNELNKKSMSVTKSAIIRELEQNFKVVF